MLPLDKVWETNPTHADIPWSQLDAHWNDPDWPGWQQLWLGNAQLQDIRADFDYRLIKLRWDYVHRSFIQETAFLAYHPELYWTVGEPVAFCANHCGSSTYDFTSAKTGATVELKSAPTKDIALERAETLDKVMYHSGHQSKYSSHGAQIVVFTDLTLTDEDEWHEWRFTRQADGSYEFDKEVVWEQF